MSQFTNWMKSVIAAKGRKAPVTPSPKPPYSRGVTKIENTNDTAREVWVNLRDSSRHRFEERVRNRAYYLWVEAGRPDCNGHTFWVEAEGVEQERLLA